LQFPGTRGTISAALLSNLQKALSMSAQFSFDFDSTNKIFRGRIDGRVTDAILKQFYSAGAEHLSRIEPCRGIFDFSGVTSLEVLPQTIRELAELEPAMPDPSRVRVILAPSDSVFGLARMFQFEGERTRPNLHVVRTLRAAWAVLGVQGPQFEPLSTP
jgi:hypothetical protein